MYYAQLVAFQSDSPFDLGTKIRVREIEDALHPDEIDKRRRELELHRHGRAWALTVDRPEPKDPDAAEREFGRLADLLTWALICLKITGDFRVGMGDVHSPERFVIRSQFAPSLPAAPATVLHDQRQAAGGLFRKHQETVTRALRRVDNLGVALYRFVMAISRPAIPDRVVDLSIAMEAMLLEGGPELVYRFRQRLAWFLGADGPDRERIFQDAKEIYDLRSFVVHGEGASKLTRREVERRKRIYDRATELCGSAIAKYLDDGYSQLSRDARRDRLNALTLGLGPE